MNAIRQFKEVENNTFTVTLPEGFNAKRVEVIIIPDDGYLREETKNLLRERLEQYRNNPEELLDFDKSLEDLEDTL